MVIAFLEICLILENHSLELHEIWHKNTLENKQLEYCKKLNFNRGNFRYSSDPSTKDNFKICLLNYI